MLAAPRTRLPGITFQVAKPPPRTVLPRMDIAAFVGFAACGPLHRPVAVEDVGRFRDLFGGELELVWDAERETTTSAHLGPAVEAFFRNGGRRCWVVRVADEGQAETNRFEIPGLFLPDLTAATARARCAGSWSDAVRVGAVLNSRSFGTPAFTHGASTVADIEAQAGEIGEGDVLRFTFAGGNLMLLPVDAVTDVGAGVQQVEGTGEWFMAVDPDATPADLLGLGPDALAAAAPLPDGSDGPLTAERLRFDLLVWEGQELRARFNDLGFDARHPRFWTALPIDDDLFDWERGAPVPIPAGLATEAADPRFPLAGPGVPPALTLPLGMASAPDPERTTPALTPALDAPTADTALRRDGLDTFTAGLFLDGPLAALGTRTIEAEVIDRLYIQEASLRGLHALWPVDEATLIAVPDAVHRGWTDLEIPLPDLLAAPELLPIALPDERDVYRMFWTGVALPEDAAEPVERYRLETSLDPLFETASVHYEGDETDAPAVAPAHPETRFYRVRAEDGNRISPWSNTRSIRLPLRDFETCAQPPVAPTLDLIEAPAPPSESLPEPDQLRWTVEELTVTLEKSADPAFLTAETLLNLDTFHYRSYFFPYRSNTFLYDLEPILKGSRYYRVRTERGGLCSPWSNTVVRSAEPVTVRATVPPADYRDHPLLDVHRALLRFCSARGDVFAALSLPQHYRTDEAAAHKGLLTPHTADDLGLGSPGELDPGTIQPLSFDEERALSFGALYHPWFYGRTDAGDFHLGPPDGAVIGTFAARALARGAWVAPANIRIEGVAALDPNLDAEWSRFFAAQVNLVQQAPRGFLALSADTLHPDPALQPINVRRLLILLRRLALREGTAYVFESNSSALRRRIYYQFDALLATLFERGAFAGATATEAYRVVNDESVNTAASVDRGRLIVELRVAPSQPLAFLTVRLVQRGIEGLTAEGA